MRTERFEATGMAIQLQPASNSTKVNFKLISKLEDVVAHQLTNKERELLQLLAQNAGICLSRRFLLGTVWGYSPDTRTRTLDVHISRLRRKLAGHSRWTIRTLFARGYVLVPEAEGLADGGLDLSSAADE